VLEPDDDVITAENGLIYVNGVQYGITNPLTENLDINNNTIV
jgi:hypothetical protein